MTTLRVAVLGLGAMGLPMARRLHGAGWAVTAWNRSAGPREVLGAEGVRTVSASGDAIEPIMLSVLPDVQQLREQLDAPDGILRELERARGDRDDLAVIRLVVMSTTGPEQVKALAADLASFGIQVVDAPVSGGDRGAQDGTLSIMVGGADDDVQAVLPALRPLGALIEHLGPLGAGSMAKLCNQIVVAGNLTATAEALVVAERAGLDPAVMVRLFQNGLARSGVLELKAEKFLSGEYPVGGNAKNQLKDLRYLETELAALGHRARIAPVLTALFADVVEAGWGEDDHAVVIELLRGDDSTY